MGYNSKFELSWSCKNNNAPDEQISNYIENNYGLKRNGSSDGYLKWYSAAKDVQNLSISFPTILFHLEVEGEQSGDIWDLYALNGQTQRHDAKIIRGEMDPNAWK